MFAAMKGHASCIEALLRRGPCPEEQLLAARRRASALPQSEFLPMLAAFMGTPLDWTAGDRMTALMLAAQRGHVECVDVLLQRRAKEQLLATRRGDGATALMLAAENGHYACFRRLLKQHPASQPLDAALRFLAARYKRKQSQGLRECIEELMALGAVSLDPETAEAVRGISADLAQRARLPHLINEAVIGALAHRGRAKL
jgi:ankyrin repeat protein